MTVMAKWYPGQMWPKFQLRENPGKTLTRKLTRSGFETGTAERYSSITAVVMLKDIVLATKHEIYKGN